MERIAKCALIAVVASVFALYGIVGVYDSVQQWTTSPSHCPPPRQGYTCITLTSDGGMSTGEELGVGLGCLAVGACLFLYAERVRRRSRAAGT